MSKLDYAIEVLKNDAKIIKRALSEWELDHYPEARKKREDRLNSINLALKKLGYE